MLELHSMKKILFCAFFLTVVFSCNSNKEERPSTALDTGRSFIRASLDGDFDEASSLLLPDTENMQLFDSYKAFYNKLPKETRQGYKQASYDINKFQEEGDTTFINYSNSYMKQPIDIRVVRKDDLWYVDFKYTYAGNAPVR